MKLFSSFIFALIIFTSCKKDEAAKRSSKELISKQSWKLTAGTQQQLPAGSVQDIFAPMSACYRDDQFVYNANLTYEGNAGVTKCSPADPQVFASGTWKFINSETQVERITTSGIGVGTIVFSVMTLTESQLKLKATDSGFKYILTFSH